MLRPHQTRSRCFYIILWRSMPNLTHNSPTRSKGCELTDLSLSSGSFIWFLGFANRLNRPPKKPPPDWSVDGALAPDWLGVAGGGAAALAGSDSFSEGADEASLCEGSGQVRSGRIRSRQITSGRGRSGQTRSVDGRSVGHIRSGPVRSGPARQRKPNVVCGVRPGECETTDLHRSSRVR